MGDANRMAWLDCLRLLAGLSMLVLHCTADPQGGAWADFHVADRIAPLALRTLAYAARTELFIIISLFLLLLSLENRPRSYRQTITEQSRRLLIPFVFWSVFFGIFSLIKAYHFGYGPAKLAALSEANTWVGFALLGNSKYHMHFLPTLFAVVLAYPLMKKAIAAPWLGFIALVLCLVVRWQLDGFFYPRFWDEPGMRAIARLIKISTHVGYGMIAAAALGIWLRRDALDLPSWFLPLAYFASLLLVLKATGTWITLETGRWSHNYAPGFWADFLMPAVLFFLAMLLGERRWPPVFSHLAKYAFGIYLCHPIFLDFCEILLIDSILSPIGQVLFKIVLTLVATSALVAALSRIPFLAWTIGLGRLPGFAKPVQTKGVV